MIRGAVSRYFTCWRSKSDMDTARMIRPSRVAGNHRDDRLAQTRARIIAHNDGRPAFCYAQVRVRKEDEHDITAPGCHRIWTLPGGPSPPRMFLAERADPSLEPRRCRERAGPPFHKP